MTARHRRWVRYLALALALVAGEDVTELPDAAPVEIVAVPGVQG